MQDALVEAMVHWPRDGVPANPGGWLATTARRKALDRLRRDKIGERKLALLAVTDTAACPDGPAAAAGHGGHPPDAGRADLAADDELLSLVFACCHPALSRDAQVALTLRAVCGLTGEQIARAFLVSDADHVAAPAPRPQDPGRHRIPGPRPRPGRARGPARAGPRGRVPLLQRGLPGLLRPPACPPRPRRAGDSADQNPAPAHAARAGGPRPARAAAAARVARRRPVRRLGQAHPPEGPGPFALERRPRGRGDGAARPGDGHATAGAVPGPGGDRRAARRGGRLRADRLAADPPALQPPPGPDAVPGGAAQPGGRHPLRARRGRGASRDRAAAGRSRRLPPLPRPPRRPAHRAGPRPRGGGRE